MYLGIIDLLMEDIDYKGNSDFDFDVCEDGEFKRERDRKRKTSREPVAKPGCFSPLVRPV